RSTVTIWPRCSHPSRKWRQQTRTPSFLSRGAKILSHKSVLIIIWYRRRTRGGWSHRKPSTNLPLLYLHRLAKHANLGSVVIAGYIYMGMLMPTIFRSVSVLILDDRF